MGAAITSPPPPVTTDAPGLRELLERNNALLEEQNRILKRERSVWVTGDEAAELLGKQVVPSGSHLKVLAYCRRHGWLVTFGQMRPYTYLRAEVMEVQRRVIYEKLPLP